MRDTLIFISIFSFLVGVFLKSFLSIENSLLVFSILFFLIYIVFYFLKNKIKPIFLIFIFVNFILGVFRFHLYDLNQNKNIFDDFVGEEVSFTGVIEDYPEKRENSQRLIVSFDNNKILVSTEKYPEFSYGDKISVFGELQKPENFITDVGKEFDYVNYLAKDSIFYTISFADVNLEVKNYKKGIKLFLYNLRVSFTSVLEKLIPTPESSLLNGLLLGQKESLGKSLEENFIKTGLIHIVVLSGYNVTIIAEFILRSLSFLGRRLSIVLGAGSIILFAFLTGLGTTIVRASIMAIIALWARFSGNGYNITRALVFAGFLMVLHNPYILYFDISFHLSFLATLGLIYLSPYFEKYFMWVKYESIRQIISATFATQIFVLPFILYKIGTLSIISPITNIIVLPLIPYTMFFGFITGVLGTMSLVLATPFAFTSSTLLSFEIFLVNFFGNLSFSSVLVRDFPMFLVLFIYIFIFWFIYKNNNIYTNAK